jgi:hypothetical protein
MNFTNSRKSKWLAVLLTIAMVATCVAIMPLGTAKAAAAKKAPNGSTKNAVFYIAVDADADGTVTGAKDAVYYYTLKEIKAYGDTQSYSFINHGVMENVSVKGAKLKNLLDNTTGIDWNSSWKIQYMEEDAYHASAENYKDTIQGLTDPQGAGNGSGSGKPADTIIGYAAMTTYEKPDANNVNETTYTNFTDYERDMSSVRAYRQGTNANDSTLKMLNGVVISPSGDLSGKNGYQLVSRDNAGNKIAPDKEILGFPAGIKWEAEPNINVGWATLDSEQDGAWTGTGRRVTIGTGSDAEVAFRYTEKPFLKVTANGRTTTFKRSNIDAMSEEYPSNTDGSGTAYKYYGYDKPMYIRYQGVELSSLLSEPENGEKVYLVTENGTVKDITDSIDKYFVAEYYSQSKSSTNISNSKRMPLNYDAAVLVDKTSAPVEYSNDDSDFNAASGQKPTIYENAQIVVAAAPAAVTGLKAKSSSKRVKLSWKKTTGAKQYSVYRATKKTGSYKKIATVKKNAYTSKKLKKGRTYYFKVRASAPIGRTYLNGTYSKVVKVKVK